MSAASDDAATARIAIRRVAAFAPAGYEEDPERQVRAARYFAARGCRFEPSVGTVDQRFSASDRDRLDELMRVACDPDVDVAIALRGGYGATRLLPSIDWPALAAGLAGGKRLVGHSDLTVVQLALLARTGAVTLAGPMAGPDFGAPSIDPFMEQHFWQAVEASRVDASFEVADALDAAPFAVRGTLWGGNLTMIASLVGTPWMPVIDDGVLFVEDVNERPYRIERMLLQLQAAGVLADVRAILCGAFSGYRPLDYDNGYGIEQAIDHVRRATGLPVVTGLPFGHVPRKLTVAVGAPIDVRVADGRCHIAQRW